LKEVFGLHPLEYPTTRQMQAPLPARAHDLMQAFANPANKAVFASIGGSDQLQLLKYLDPAVLLANPKPFFCFSDNTHLHTFLWNLGIPSYYGGAVMTQLAMSHQMHDYTMQSLNNALFTAGERFSQRAVGRKLNLVEQVRQPKLTGFLGPGIQDGLGGGRHQRWLTGRLGGELTGGEQPVHIAQPDEGFAQAHGQGDAGQPPALDGSQHLVLQDLLTGGCATVGFGQGRHRGR
jgi:muramoyltetrapeptide carboxypeptidase LdcA involved in peptidoglycan recycling